MVKHFEILIHWPAKVDITFVRIVVSFFSSGDAKRPISHLPALAGKTLVRLRQQGAFSQRPLSLSPYFCSCQIEVGNFDIFTVHPFPYDAFLFISISMTLQNGSSLVPRSATRVVLSPHWKNSVSSLYIYLPIFQTPTKDSRAKRVYQSPQ